MKTSPHPSPEEPVRSDSHPARSDLQSEPNLLSRICNPTLVLALIFSEVLVVLLSWLLSAAGVEEVRSMLSSEGIRWFFGTFTHRLLRPLLVWLLLCSMAAGSLQKSGLLRRQETYRQRVALRLAVALLAVYVVVIMLLTLLPHAILLSPTGALVPSPFSRSLVPVAAFGVIVTSLFYGYMSGRFLSVHHAIFSLEYGVKKASPLILIYVLALQLADTVRFVFF